MKRYWASWWSGYYQDEGCTKPPFQVWISGTRDRQPEVDRNEVSICAVIDAETPDEIWQSVKKHFPDFEVRFCTPRESDWIPNDRFPGFANQTLLNPQYHRDSK